MAIGNTITIPIKQALNRRRRMDLGLTQGQLGQLLSIGESTVYNWSGVEQNRTHEGRSTSRVFLKE
jgi:hypothetical protein